MWSPFTPRMRRWIPYFALIAAVVAIAGDALIELDSIEVVRSAAILPMSGPTATDLTLVHISDVHVGSFGRRERRAIEIINAAAPDLIVLSGDLVHDSNHPRDLETFLSSLRARYGKFAVWGNHDHWSGIPDTWGPDVLRRSGFTLLCNSSARVTHPGGTIMLAGLDDPITAHDNLRLAMSNVRRDDLCLLVSHTPETARNLGNWGIDMVLAGHTHGGQVRLPIVGALIVPFGTRDFLEGWFDISPGVRLHVNRGLGWSYLPVRFRCPPAIDIITLRPEPAGNRS